VTCCSLNGNFNNVQVWTYGYLLKRIGEVAEEYGITVIYVDEAYTSSKCPLHSEECGKRIERGLFKCKKLNKVFNADLVACNILITPSPTDRSRCSPKPSRFSWNPFRAGRKSENYRIKSALVED